MNPEIKSMIDAASKSLEEAQASNRLAAPAMCRGYLEMAMMAIQKAIAETKKEVGQ